MTAGVRGAIRLTLLTGEVFQFVTESVDGGWRGELEDVRNPSDLGPDQLQAGKLFR